MAQGFIVTKLNTDGNPVEYWNGTAFVSEIDSSDFIETKPEARYIQGSTQAQDTENDIAIRDAEVNVTLI